jgi:hypothetical protein
MRGVIKECHFDSAEKCFPGIRSFYLTLAHKPATFLELVWEYEKAIGRLCPENSNTSDPHCQATDRQAR